MADAKGGSNEKKGGKGLVIGVTVSVLVIIVLLVIVIVLLMRNNNQAASEALVDTPDTEIKADAPPEEETEQRRRNVLVTEENVAEIAASMEEEDFQVPGYYTATMNSTWHFPSGNEPSSDSYVENVVENTNDVYFDIFLADDSENPIYESPIMPRGSRLSAVALDTPLDAGTYDCILIYHLIDDQQNTISTVSFSITLIVEQ